VIHQKNGACLNSRESAPPLEDIRPGD
jgi:hypothetical protein